MTDFAITLGFWQLLALAGVVGLALFVETRRAWIKGRRQMATIASIYGANWAIEQLEMMGVLDINNETGEIKGAETGWVNFDEGVALNETRTFFTKTMKNMR